MNPGTQYNSSVHLYPLPTISLYYKNCRLKTCARVNKECARVNKDTRSFIYLFIIYLFINQSF